MSDYTGNEFTGSGSAHPDDERRQSSSHDAASVAPPSAPGLISSASAPTSGRVSEVWAESADHTAETATAAPASPPATPSIELTASECRVLGAMIEKSYLTPDVYPMTTNAMVTACNQKTNRDPVVDYSAVDIDGTLMELRGRNLVRRVHSPGSRSTKHRQTLDEALALNERQLALISVLLLRGPQTLGELRLRTERHDVGFDDLESVERCLESMANRPNPLVQELPRQPGHKENRWQHLLLTDAEVLEQPSTRQTSPAPTAAPTHAQSTPEPKPSAPDDTALSRRVDELESQVATLHRQLASLAEKLGEPLE